LDREYTQFLTQYFEIIFIKCILKMEAACSPEIPVVYVEALSVSKLRVYTVEC
jgi:hypothetical protein